MRVRIQRTTTIPATGAGGIPSRKVRGRTTLTVGAGYDLPEEVAADLIARGLAQPLDEPAPEAEPAPKPERARRSASDGGA